MDMRDIERASAMLCDLLKEITERGDLDRGNAELTCLILGGIKDACKIKMLEEEEDSYGDWSARGSYSRANGNSYRGGYSRGNNSYDGGNSYRSRHWVRGHYSRDGYSRAEGIEYLKEEMQKMMQNGELDPDQRMTVEKAMDMLK